MWKTTQHTTFQPTRLMPGKTDVFRVYFYRGVTLIELMVVVAIMAILAAIAAPSFSGLIASTNISKALNAFIADTRFARAEAMRRGKNVVICRTTDSNASAPVCSSGDGVDVGGWMEGWVVFVDEDDDKSFDNGSDLVLRVQEQITGIGDFFAVGKTTISAVSNRNHISFDANGRAIGQEARWLIHASGSLKSDDAFTRTLCMNSVGRVRFQKGGAAC